MSALYVFGVEGELTVKNDPPRVWRGESRSVGGKKTSWVRYGWPAVGSSWHSAKTGLVEEPKCIFGDHAGKRCWFRRLAPEAAPLLAEMDRRIEEATAALKKLRAERQELLAAWLPNSDRVRASECVDPRKEGEA